MALRPDLAIGLPLSRAHLGAPANRCVRGLLATQTLGHKSSGDNKIVTDFGFVHLGYLATTIEQNMRDIRINQHAKYLLRCAARHVVVE